jgi:3-oxoacyl-[acyl-carrier-protein] synthase II
MTRSADAGPAETGADVVITGMQVVTAFGAGLAPLRAGLRAGAPAFRPVTRFEVSRRRVGVAATLDGSPDLVTTMSSVIDEACRRAALDEEARRSASLLLAMHADPAAARLPGDQQAGSTPAAVTARLAERFGLHGPHRRSYVNACTAASTAVADAADLIRLGRADTVIVAAGYLVDADNFAAFDAGLALAKDGRLRPFSAGRQGLLLGDAVGAVVLRSRQAAHHAGTAPLATLHGWGRAGDAYHVCRPHPQGHGMARAITTALGMAGVEAAELGYVNAHGTGTPHNDAAESAAMHRALGPAVAAVPVSSTKGLLGHTLEASGVLELITTVEAITSGSLPVNAGYQGADPACRLDLIVGDPRPTDRRYALSLNAAFGGANTAILMGRP